MAKTKNWRVVYNPYRGSTPLISFLCTKEEAKALYAIYDEAIELVKIVKKKERK